MMEFGINNNIYTCYPDGMNFNVSQHQQKFLHEMKRLIFFEEALPRILKKRRSGHSGFVFTDGAAASIHDFSMRMASGGEFFQMPDILIFLRFPSLETNISRTLSSGYSLQDIKSRQRTLDDLHTKFWRRSVVVNLEPEDQPDVVFGKIKEALHLYYKVTTLRTLTDFFFWGKVLTLKEKFIQRYCDLNLYPENLIKKGNTACKKTGVPRPDGKTSIDQHTS